MRLTSKGQVTIPLKFRERFGLHPYMEVVFEEKDGELIIRAKESRKDGFKRWLENNRGRADVRKSADQIMKLTRGDQ